MPADYAWFASPLLSLLASYLLHSTCLLGSAGLFFLCCRNTSPRLRSWVWKTAATAGFITAPLALSLSSTAPVVEFSVIEPPKPLHTRTGVESQRDPFLVLRHDPTPSISEFIITEAEFEGELDAQSRPDAELRLAETETPHVMRHSAIADNETVMAPPTVTAVRETSPPAWREHTLIALLLLASASFLLGIVRLSSQRFWVRRLYSGSRLLSAGPAAEELADLRRQQQLKRHVCLLSSAHYPEPAAFGILRWHIVLPDRAEQELSREELRSLLAHELAHLVRRDTWWLCVGRLLCTAFAYQPLNFLASRGWQRAAEFICDEWAVSRTGNRLALARCLTTVAQWRLGTPKLSGAIAATGHRSSLSHRIESLVNETAEKQPRSSLRSLALTAAVLTAVIGLITVGPIATFALPSLETIAEPRTEPITANVFTDVLFSEQPTESDEEWPALQAELTALSEELGALESLLIRTRSDPELAERTSRLRGRISEIERLIPRLEQFLHEIPSAPGSAGGTAPIQQTSTETDHNK